MNRVTFSLIFLLLLIKIVQCKKYLVEVEDKKDSNAMENRDWWRKVKEESDEETIEDNATTESEGKYVNKKMKINFLKQLVK